MVKDTSENPAEAGAGKPVGPALDGLYTADIVTAFAKEMEDNGEAAWRNYSKEEIIRKFQEFVKKKYGGNMLYSLYARTE
jgi:hypothetical protein